MMSRRTAITGLAAGAIAARAAAAPRARLLDRPAPGGRDGWAEAADGNRIRTTRYGAGDLTLVLVHGWTCDRSYWNAQVAGLRADFPILTLDLVGHGESDAARTAWSMEGLGDDVARAVAASGPGRVVLVGHSMGGPVVIEAARRLGERVAGVMTVDIFPTLERTPSTAPALTPATFAATVAPSLRKGMFVAASDPRLADRIVRAMSAADPVRALALAQALGRYDPRAGVAAVADRPLAMVYAPARKVDVAGIERAHPGTRIAVVEDAGHFLMMERPAVFNALLAAEVARMRGQVRVLG